MTTAQWYKIGEKDAERSFSDEEKKMIELLIELGQDHVANISKTMESRKKVLEQCINMESYYPGGIKAYITGAKSYLEASARGENPYKGFVPSVPSGETLTAFTDEFNAAEKKGLEEIDSVAFCLVAGGMGERLGYNGIKVELPMEVSTGTCFLGYYAKNILALQEQAEGDVTIPLAIMTSGDTHDLTVKLIKENDNFGLKEGQIILMKQQLVPALSDSKASLTVNEDGIVMKPHGHGDVHTLLFNSGTAEQFSKMGKKWVVFFQDTNGLVFHSVPALLGVSASNDFEVNSLCVPRRPNEAVGALMQLTHDDGRSMTINVEYNQLDALLRDTISPKGDVPDATGFSPYPGSINVLLFALEPYLETLKHTGGMMPEFVNPKYADESMTTFKKPTRLECMMQDYPKLLDASAKVGFTSMERWVCFSAVKNNLTDAAKKFEASGSAESAASGEDHHYRFFRNVMSEAGVEVAEDAKVCIMPSAGVTIEQLKKRFKGKDVKIESGSTLIVEGDVTFESLELKGTLSIEAREGAKVTVKDLKVKNAGWTTKPSTSSSHPHYVIRGYEPVKLESKSLVFTEVKEHVVSGMMGKDEAVKRCIIL